MEAATRQGSQQRNVRAGIACREGVGRQPQAGDRSVDSSDIPADPGRRYRDLWTAEENKFTDETKQEWRRANGETIDSYPSAEALGRWRAETAGPTGMEMYSRSGEDGIRAFAWKAVFDVPAHVFAGLIADAEAQGSQQGEWVERFIIGHALGENQGASVLYETFDSGFACFPGRRALCLALDKEDLGQGGFRVHLESVPFDAQDGIKRMHFRGVFDIQPDPENPERCIVRRAGREDQRLGGLLYPFRAMIANRVVPSVARDFVRDLQAYVRRLSAVLAVKYPTRAPAGALGSMDGREQVLSGAGSELNFGKRTRS